MKKKSCYISKHIPCTPAHYQVIITVHIMESQKWFWLNLSIPKYRCLPLCITGCLAGSGRAPSLQRSLCMDGDVGFGVGCLDVLGTAAGCAILAKMVERREGGGQDAALRAGAAPPGQPRPSLFLSFAQTSDAHQSSRTHILSLVRCLLCLSLTCQKK